MQVFVTGATGFVGRALIPVLQREGHRVVAFVRSPAAARSQLGADVEPVATSVDDGALAAALNGCDAIVNLAGEPVVGRWTATRREAMRASRVDLTRRLVAALARAERRPAVLVSGSAVGFYGDRGDERLDESSRPGNDFLARLCVDWEAAASAAENHGVRVLLLRTGVVLGRDGGALARMLPPFRLGLGGRLGGGRQFMPWIHLHDLVGVVAAAIADERYRGPVNGSAPTPIRSEEFTKTLAAVLHRPAIVPIPSFALRVAFGEASQVLLGSQRAEPKRLEALGYRFRFPTLSQALDDILRSGPVEIGPLSETETPSGPSAAKDQTLYRLRTITTLDVPLDEVFAFFSKPANLGLLTPAAMRFRIEREPADLREGATIDYTLQVGPVPLRWRTRIERWEPPTLFIDSQERGPYASWRHEHHFRAVGSRTVMEDRVYYTPPLGILGRFANPLFIAAQLRAIFAHRNDVIRLRFGDAAAGQTSVAAAGTQVPKGLEPRPQRGSRPF